MPNTLIYLIGNKCEMEQERQVEFERALEFATNNGIHKFFEVSAKSGENVKEVFSIVTKDLKHRTPADDDSDAASQMSSKVNKCL